MAQQDTAPQVPELDLFTVVIYQNIAYVGGLYQQLRGGKPSEATVHQNDQSSTDSGANAAGGAKILGIIDLTAGATFSHQGGTASGRSQTMTFDQATLLHGVRQALREKDLVQVVDSPSAYQSLKPGDFVEYRATFEPNVVTSLLDVMTPEILAKIVTAKLAQDRLQGVEDLAERTRLYDSASLDGQLAAGIFEATQREFRNDTSAEYYGRVIPGDDAGNLAVQAVTICDKAMFDGGDTDRILDGQFRVLGKVIKTGEGYSMFDRNKVLSRMKREAIEEAEKTIAKSDDLKKYLHTELNLTSTDATMHVIPIAVFI